MTTADSESPAPQLVSERGCWYVPVRWADADNVRSALARLGLPSTVCLNPETREARLELWPGVSPAEFLAAYEHLRGKPVPPLRRPTPVAKGPAEPDKAATPTAQGA
ncbi:MAG TPA: hypothetical protein VKD90_02430 [Gemmataceae bacterium]|nr:hypothetical protein [Gemmataceae bacterium]